MGLLTRPSIWLAALVVCACSADVGVDLARIDGPRLLAVASSPAEAAPGAEVELRGLWVDEGGSDFDRALRWTMCIARRSLDELAPIAERCVVDEGDAQLELGLASVVRAEIPDDACRLFGPDPPPAQPGEPQGRPVEPDLTGGYYQPVLARADDELAGYGVRLDCGTAGATQAQAAVLRARHRNNVAPVVEVLTAVVDGGAAQRLGSRDVLHVDAGAEVELTAGWPVCAREPSCGDGQCTIDETAEQCPDECGDTRGCTGAEWYALLDPIALDVTEQREAISVAWYSTAGDLDAARTGRAANDATASVDNRWIAPDDAQQVTLWVVVRDDRGAVSWRTQRVDVR